MEQQNNGRFIADYEPGMLDLGEGYSSFWEFEQELEELLSSSLQKEEAMSLHSMTIYPWLTLTLIFASTTIAATIITKMSEDLYNRFKERIVRGHGKKTKDQDLPWGPTQMRITIDIHIQGQSLASGKIECPEYKTAIDALSTLSRLLVDSNPVNEGESASVEPVISADNGSNESAPNVDTKDDQTQRPNHIPARFHYDNAKGVWVREDA